MTNQEILHIAMQQSAWDCACTWEDFLSDQHVMVQSHPHEQARRYLTLPFDCNLVSYGNNIVASVKPEVEDLVKRYIHRFAMAHCFETPNLHVLGDELQAHGLRICFMAEYFLPDVDLLHPLPCDLDLRLLGPEDFSHLYTSQWGNALSADRRELDVIGLGAYEGGQLVGLAGASADCDAMWQIGIDVAPSHRRWGVASALTSRLALEILKRGKVPFYCAAWSNLPSVRNAIKSGFRPAWVEMTAKSSAFVDQMNGVESPR